MWLMRENSFKMRAFANQKITLFQFYIRFCEVLPIFHNHRVELYQGVAVLKNKTKIPREFSLTKQFFIKAADLDYNFTKSESTRYVFL